MTLHDYLTANGLSEASFAERVGVSQAQIHRLRVGKTWPSRDLAIRIRDETGGQVTPDSFLPSSLGGTQLPD